MFKRPLFGIFLAAGFALPCLSLPLTLSPASLPVGKTNSEGFGDQVNSSLVTEEEIKEEEMETKEDEGVEEDIRNQRVGFHNDSHGTLNSKGW